MNKILEVKFGSHLYGTNTPNSDLDLKAIYLPTAKEICLGNYKETICSVRPKQPFERNTKDDVDVEVFSLDRYLQLLGEGQTVALDMLFAPKENFTYCGEDFGLFQEIFNNRHEVLSKNVQSFVAYAKNQAAKYGLKGFRVHALRCAQDWLSQFPDYTRIEDHNYAEWIKEVNSEYIQLVECKGPNGIPALHIEICNKKYAINATVKYIAAQVQRRFQEYGARALMAENNEGIDFKALSHSVRVNSEAKELLETAFITFPRPDKDLLLKIKTGQMPYKEIAELIENGLEELKSAQEKSTLRESPNVDWVDNFIYTAYKRIVKND